MVIMEKLSIHKTKDNNYVAIIGVSALIFIVNPFIGMVLSLVMGFFLSKKDLTLARIICIYVVFFACLVQLSANVHNSMTDWSSYSEEFNAIRNISFSKFVSEIYKEPLWSFLNYVLFFVLDGNGYVFVKLIAMSTFILVGYSIYKYWRYTDTSPFVLVSMLALLFFFKEYWGSIANLLRMQFALSIVSVGFVKKLTTGKTPWVIYICAALIHTFCIIFLLLSFIKLLYKKVKSRDMGVFLVLSFAVLILMSRLSFFQAIFSNIEVLSYGFDRLSTAMDPGDQNRLEVSTVYTNALVVGGVCVFMNYVTKPLPQNLFFTNLLLVLMILCAALASVTPELMSRLYVSRYLIFPFVLPYICVRYRAVSMVLSFGIFGYFLYRFCETFDTISGGGVYPRISEIFSSTIFSYI